MLRQKHCSSVKRIVNVAVVLAFSMGVLVNRRVQSWMMKKTKCRTNYWIGL